jgi:hypothetical protein
MRGFRHHLAKLLVILKQFKVFKTGRYVGKLPDGSPAVTDAIPPAPAAESQPTPPNLPRIITRRGLGCPTPEAPTAAAGVTIPLPPAWRHPPRQPNHHH